MYRHLTILPHMQYSLVFPSITVLFAFAFAHLIVLGVFAELVVKVGDFKQTETILAIVDGPGESHHEQHQQNIARRA